MSVDSAGEKLDKIKGEKYLSFPSSIYRYYFTSMSQIIGEVSAGTLQRAGIEFGKKSAITFRKENRKVTLREALRVIEELGLGRIRLENDTVYLEGSFEAETVGQSTKPACNLTTGIIHGICIGLALNYVYFESECRAQGKPRCVFKKRELKWHERVQSVI
jgi:Predicted hydrocarbon binding protein (contains V4R domain)